MSFVHLHLHTAYSLVNGLARIEPLMEAVAAAGMPAVALTDQGNLFAAVKFYRAARAAGVKPILGADLSLRIDDVDAGDAPRLCRVVLLARNAEGWRNLKILVSRGYTQGLHRGVPLLQREGLEAHAEGLIALCGPASDIGQAWLADERERAGRLLEWWRRLFPSALYLQVQRTGRADEERWVHGAVELAHAWQIPPVASNETLFLARDDFEAHEARVCIHEGRILSDPRRPRPFSMQQYLRTPEEMAALFADLPEALENALEIAKRCNVTLTLDKTRLPDFPLPDNMALETFFRREAEQGLARRLVALDIALAPQGLGQMDADESNNERSAAPQGPPPAAGQMSASEAENGTSAAPQGPPLERGGYVERLESELRVILDMGYAGYFLIVADFIRWARARGIPVGPGRGSGAGSLVAWALGITDLDPIEYKLLFERFLNPERVSMPDFDIDFCMDRRDEVIDYVAEKYGRDRVAQIITYGSMNAKAVVRDVGRALGHPYGMVDRIAKMIPFDLKMTLEKALKESPDLRRSYDEEEEVRELIDLARSLEGLPRNAGRHAGGLVIAPSPLTDFTPLYCDEQGDVVTQFDMHDVEAAGLVKFDFLGLRTLTIIANAVQTVNRLQSDEGAAALEIERLPLDDPAVFALLQSCRTTGVFQLESSGIREVIARLQPDNFGEIIDLLALFRPGPLESGMVDDYVACKHGKAVVYPHPALEELLRPTYGVILYQEQVMEIARTLSGYTLGGADLLRRAMGKKKAEAMARQRDAFVDGAVERGVKRGVAVHIFDQIEKFAGYGFNRSHSAAYALLSYQTAWLKAHHPAPFMAAALSADMEHTERVVLFIDECRAMGLEVRPPDLNSSDYRFTVRRRGEILYGLGAVKGVGAGAVEAIVAARGETPYGDLFDLCRRVDGRRVNKRALAGLINAGAMDSLLRPPDDQPPWSGRSRLTATLPAAMQAAERHGRDRAAGQNDLFGAAETEERSACVDAPPWTEEERLRREQEALGLYLTGHPLDQYRDELAHIAAQRIAELRADRARSLAVAGLIAALRVRKTRNGKRMAIVTLDDQSGRIEATLFSEVWEKCRPLVEKGRLAVVRGIVEEDEYTKGLRIAVDELYDLEGARTRWSRGIWIAVDAAQVARGFAERLAATLAPHRQRADGARGDCPVFVQWRRDDARVAIALDKSWRVNPTDELLRRLETLPDVATARLKYDAAAQQSA